MPDRAKLFKQPEDRGWSREFLELAGSAPDFPYPEEPPLAEPGPDRSSPLTDNVREFERIEALKIENWRLAR